MSDTTNLADLPMDPVSSGDGQNVVLHTSDKPSIYDPNIGIAKSNKNGQYSVDEQKLMNEMVTGIQQAAASGATTLSSRDIPMNTVHFADEQIKPNFVPQKEEHDYIQNTDTEQEIMARRMRNQNSRDSLEILYDEFQIPIIIGLLYFIFQLPIVRSKILVMLPSLFNKDGNPNLTGYIVNSIFFGISYYVISRLLTHLQHI